KSVSTDTRLLEPGALFVAIKAERDGLAFLPDAAAKGAIAALVEAEPEIKLPNVHLIKVQSTRAALAKLATHVRKQISAHDIAVITNCFAEHLEGLGDLMGVRREEASLIEGLDIKSGLLVVNGDDQALLDAVAHYKGKKITFGFSDKNDLFATDVICDTRGVKFKLNGRRDVFIPLLGRHTAANALAAIAVARRVGLSEELIIESLSHATGPDMRLQIQ